MAYLKLAHDPYLRLHVLMGSLIQGFEIVLWFLSYTGGKPKTKTN